MSIRCRPLTDDELGAVLGELETPRDRLLLLMGVYTGFRVSELCQVRVMDVWQYGKAKSELTVSKAKMKGSKASRTVALHAELREAITKLVVESEMKGTDFLFKSRNLANSPISRSQAWRVLKRAFVTLELTGNVATHSMRKTFAMKIYEGSGGNIFTTQTILGHASATSTVSYLPVDQNGNAEIVKGISFNKVK